MQTIIRVRRQNLLIGSGKVLFLKALFWCLSLNEPSFFTRNPSAPGALEVNKVQTNAQARPARDRLRELTSRKRLLLPVDEIVQDVNTFLRGWGGYFRYGNSARHFDKTVRHALTSVTIFVANRHERPTKFGRKKVAYLSPDNLGLIKLAGSVIAPRLNRPWRVKSNATGEGRR